MSSLNKVLVIGNLGQDPEVRYMPNNDCVCNISIATSERWKDKNSGEQKEKTEWHRVVLWRRLGEIAGQYLRKGSKVYIEGKLETRKWQDNNGNDRYNTEIIASEMKMLDSAGQGQNNQQQQQQQGGGYQNRNSQGRQEPPPQQQQQQYQQPQPQQQQQQQYQQAPPQQQQYQQQQTQQGQQGQGYPDDIPF